MARISPFRFLSQPYFALNGAVILCYVLLRTLVWADSKAEALTTTDGWGLTREQELLLICALASLIRLRRADSTDAWLASTLTFLRLIVVWLAYLCDKRAAVWLALAFGVLYFAVTRREYDGVTAVVPIRSARDYATIIEADDRDGTGYLLLCVGASWSDAWLSFSATFANLSLRFTSPHLRFAKLLADSSASAAMAANDAATQGGAADDSDAFGGGLHGVLQHLDLPVAKTAAAMQTAANRIPTLILLTRGGRELGRLPTTPVLNSGKPVPLTEKYVTKYFSLPERSAGPLASDRDVLALAERELAAAAKAGDTAAGKRSRRR